MSAGDGPTPAPDGFDAYGTRPLPLDWTLGPSSDATPAPVCLDNVHPGAGYALLGRIGIGVYGEVFEAEAPGGVKVAVKRLFWPPNHPASQSEVKSLEATKSLSHPFLLKTHAYFVFADRLHIVMELAEESLADRVEYHRRDGRDGVPPGELVAFFEQAAQALEYLHREGVSHRDVKPQNLLLLRGYAKVADFGLARSLSHTLTVLPGQVGTPMYMAPEVWEKRLGLHGSDQYSLAVAYVVARLGRPPYQESLSLLELADAHKHAPPDLQPLPPAEQRVLLRALAKDPADRYPSCVAFADDLRQALLDRQQSTGSSIALPAAPPNAPQARPVSRQDLDDAQAHYHTGYAQYVVGDAEGAVAAYREAIRLDPTFARAHSNLGNALKAAGDPAGAVAAYREAIRLDPSYAKTQNNLGVALEAVGDADGAIAAYCEAVRLAPTDSLYRNNLGNALLAAGDAAAAAAAYREAARLDPLDSHYQNCLGVALEALGDVAGAVAAYQRAARLDPREALYQSNLGNALKARGDATGAIAAYREAVRLDPAGARAHNNLGIALEAGGDRDGAVAAYRDAVRLDPNYVRAHNNLGNALYAAGATAGAVAAYREAIRLAPAYAKAHNNLGVVLEAGGDGDGAVAAYREAIRLDPRYARAHGNLGHALYARGDLDGAIAAYREAIRLDPAYTKAHNNLGYALQARGDLDGAIAALREAVRLDPDNPRRRKALDRMLKLKS